MIMMVILFDVIVSSDRSSYSDDVQVYIQRPLFEILGIQAVIRSFSFHRVIGVSPITLSATLNGKCRMSNVEC